MAIFDGEGGGDWTGGQDYGYQQPDYKLDFSPDQWASIGPPHGRRGLRGRGRRALEPGPGVRAWMGGNTGLGAGAPGALSFAAAGAGHYYDTTSGQIQTPSGQQIAVEEYLKTIGGPDQGGGADVPSGQVESTSGGGSSSIVYPASLAGLPAYTPPSNAEQGRRLRWHSRSSSAQTSGALSPPAASVSLGSAPLVRLPVAPEGQSSDLPAEPADDRWPGGTRASPPGADRS